MTPVPPAALPHVEVVLPAKLKLKFEFEFIPDFVEHGHDRQIKRWCIIIDHEQSINREQVSQLAEAGYSLDRGVFSLLRIYGR